MVLLDGMCVSMPESACLLEAFRRPITPPGKSKFLFDQSNEKTNISGH